MPLPTETANAQSATAPAPAPARAADAPSVVVDLSSSASSSYVIEWRDPATHELLLQLPMRSAMPQAAAPAAGGVGQHVNTAA